VISSYYSFTSIKIRCFERITFDESTANAQPKVERFEDKISLTYLNSDYHSKGIKIFDPNYALQLYQFLDNK